MENNLIHKSDLKQIRRRVGNRDIKLVTAPASIISITANSLAAKHGLKIGDRILEINGQRMQDIFDFDFTFAQEDQIELLIDRDGKQFDIEIEKEPEDNFGASFTTPVFNGVRECANKCPFCFIENQPYENTRESLHLRDDDFRLSYLHGTYITLTNLSYSDRVRIEELRPGPLYVSVHATEAALRNIMLGRKKSIPILEELRWLDSLGIPVHTQIVVCPGLNDGKALEQTIKELFTLKDKPVVSVAVVPVGLTKYHRGQLRRMTTDEAFETINIIEDWEKINPRKHKNFVFLSDEFYLMTHSPVPEKKYYGDYPQLEDGVGMTRMFLEELEQELTKLKTTKIEPQAISWINGTISKPIIEKCAQLISSKIPGLTLKPIFLESIFWGTTNVSGLLTGNDIVQGLKYIDRKLLGDKIIIPSVMLKSDSDIFLDDMTLTELEQVLGVTCKKAWGAKELLTTIIELSNKAHHPPQQICH